MIPSFFPRGQGRWIASRKETRGELIRFPALGQRSGDSCRPSVSLAKALEVLRLCAEVVGQSPAATYDAITPRELKAALGPWPLVEVGNHGISHNCRLGFAAGMHFFIEAISCIVVEAHTDAPSRQAFHSFVSIHV
jgi:hypothetical protein